MTTIFDPLGTPVVVFNRSGVAIIAINAAGTDQSTATQLQRLAGTTVVSAHTANGQNSVKLPNNAEIGDIFEISFNESAGNPSGGNIWPFMGETINGLSGNWVSNSAGNGSISLRKTSATDWTSSKQ